MPKHTIKSIQDLSLKEQKALFVEARDVYYNSDLGAQIMTDKVFDALHETLLASAPKWVKAQGTGAPVCPVKGEKLGKKVEVPLAVPCASLDKVKPAAPAKLTKFVQRISGLGKTAVLMSKLDGSSLLSTYNNGKLVSLVTRGDGVLGKDVTFLAPHTTLPQTIPYKGLVHFRHEAIVQMKVWDKKWREDFISDRAMASAVFNRQDAHPALKDVHLVVVRAHVANKLLSLTDGLELAKKAGHLVVRNRQVPVSKLTMDLCENALSSLRQIEQYRTDGMVIMSNAPGLEATKEDPDYAIAFKVDSADAAPLATITEIVWRASGHGKLVPKAKITPTDFDGVTVVNCSIHNPKLAMENGWGVGAQVRLIRSGEIIPKIVETVKPAKFVIPAKIAGEVWVWDDNKTHIYAKDNDANIKIFASGINRMLTSLDFEHLGPSAAQQLALYYQDKQPTEAERYLMVLSDLVSEPTETLLKATPSHAIASKSAKAWLKKTGGKITLEQAMHASNFFPEGFGQRRFSKIVDFVKSPFGARKNFIDRSTCVEVLGPVFGNLFHENADAFFSQLPQWLSKDHFKVAVVKKVKLTSTKLQGQIVSMTGYRDADQVAKIEAAGGVFQNFSSKTTVLLFKQGGKASSKVDKAQAAGIKVCTFADLSI